MSREVKPGEAFWDARRGPVTFFVVTWATALSLGLWSTLIQERAPDWVKYGLLFGVPAIVLGVIASPWFLRLWPMSRLEPEGSLVRSPAAARGLVVVASQGKGIGSAEAAIRHHAERLERLWVIVSESATPSWQGLRAKLLAEGVLEPGEIEAVEVSDSLLNDPEAIHSTLEERVFARLPEGLAESDVMLDLTGGPKATTAGTVLSGLPPGRRLQLVLPETKNDQGYADKAGELVEVAINYRLKRAKPR